MEELDDDVPELMRRFKQGSEDATRELVAKHGPQILRTVRRLLRPELRSKLDSLDLLQDVLASLFRIRDRLDNIETSEQLTAFLMGMVRNKLRRENRRFRTQKRRLARELALDDLPGGASRLADRRPSQTEVWMLAEQLSHVLESRPRRDLRIVKLRIQGLTWEAIGKTLGIDAKHAQKILAKLLHQAFRE